MRRVLVSCLVLASIVSSTKVPTAEADDGTGFALRVLELTNAERQNAGLAPLSLNSQLADSAQSYSQVLAGSGCFDHTCGPIPSIADRDGQAGYTGWTSLGENIAGGYSTPEAVVAGWMASTGHRKNILSPEFTEIGIGVASGGGKFGTYWTQEFGARD